MAAKRKPKPVDQEAIRRTIARLLRSKHEKDGLTAHERIARYVHHEDPRVAIEAYKVLAAKVVANRHDVTTAGEPISPADLDVSRIAREVTEALAPLAPGIRDTVAPHDSRLEELLAQGDSEVCPGAEKSLPDAEDGQDPGSQDKANDR